MEIVVLLPSYGFLFSAIIQHADRFYCHHFVVSSLKKGSVTIFSQNQLIISPFLFTPGFSFLLPVNFPFPHSNVGSSQLEYLLAKILSGNRPVFSVQIHVSFLQIIALFVFIFSSFCIRNYSLIFSEERVIFPT